MTPTNEAGHGLPELPESVWLSDVPVGTPLYTAAHVQQYAKDYAAALALSRGVPDGGLGAFTEYFVKNYPGPNTVICDPKWHAPRIFRAARHAMLAAAPAAAGAQGEDEIDRAARRMGDSARSLLQDIAKQPAPQPAAADGGVRERDDGASVSKRPTSAMKLLRFGRGNGATPWILEPHIDGYWTPWHVAQSELDMAVESAAQLERELEKALTQQCALSSHRQAGELEAEVARLNAIINTPQSDDFLRAVSTEAEHQRQRWGSSHDSGKAPADWFWLVGYLAGKALHAHAAGDLAKAEHHIITTAAALANWHLSMFGETDMRPGIDGESSLALVEKGAGNG